MFDYYFIEIPLEDTRWENLTFNEYYNMSDEERQEFREYLISINAPYGDDFTDEDDPPGAYFCITWRDIVSFSDDSLERYKLYRESRAMAPPMPEVKCDNNDDLPF